MILRRLYLYLVSAAALAMFAAGLALLGYTGLLFFFNDPSAQSSRGSLAGFSAMVLVAGPVWAVHFWFARRFAMRDPSDRASAIRRLYVYWACLGGSIGGAVALAITAGDVLRPLIDTCPVTQVTQLTKGGASAFGSCPANQNWVATSQAAWIALVCLVIWAFHFWTAAQDRGAVGETGASATLRRWYMYVALLVGLLVMLSGASSLITVVWVKAVNSPLGVNSYIGDPAGLLMGGLLLWGFHARTIARNHADDDRHSTLRALQGFIAVAVAIGIALFGASRILYYALALLLGVSSPGGVTANDILGALASPASALLVYGIAWVLIRRRLARDAGTQEADRQAGIRRLYTNLAALVSLAAWSAGAVGLLWVVAEQIEAPIIGVNAADWKDPVSLWITLLLVGAAVWVAHWRQAPWAADRQALSRRLYVWAALLASVLAVLGGGVGMLNSLLQQLFSAHPKLKDPSNLDFGHYLAVIVVAAAVAVYHWRVLRADAAARPRRPATAPAAEAPPPPHPSEPGPAVVPAPVATGAQHSRRYTLVVSDATDDDVHQALAALPPQASYRLTPSEPPVDGR
ncbi:MAG TPA: DUF5671 domain-containing protein [Candidatus Dormibacteraeota bacterium]|nr:DUF5671 domain-containing protein [Candidatus Dormibacteraeota bacterium]